MPASSNSEQSPESTGRSGFLVLAALPAAAAVVAALFAESIGLGAVPGWALLGAGALASAGATGALRPRAAAPVPIEPVSAPVELVPPVIVEPTVAPPVIVDPEPDRDAPAEDASSDAGRPLVDSASLMERLGGDRELLGELIELFEMDTPHRLAALREAVADGDADGVARAAHGIKSGLSNFCAHVAQERAFALERAGREGHLPEDAAEQVDELEACLDKVVVALTALTRERAA